MEELTLNTSLLMTYDTHQACHTITCYTRKHFSFEIRYSDVWEIIINKKKRPTAYPNPIHATGLQ